VRKAGYDNLSLDQLIRMKDHGVDAEFIRRAKSQGFQNLSLDQLIRLRDAGVLDCQARSAWFTKRLRVKLCIMTGTAMPRSYRGTGVSPVNDRRSVRVHWRYSPPARLPGRVGHVGTGSRGSQKALTPG